MSQESLLSISHHAWPAARLRRLPNARSLLLPIGGSLGAYLVAMEGAAAGIGWLAGLGLLLSATAAAARATRREIFCPWLATVSYVLLTLSALALIHIYRRLYGLDFGPWADDSYYYYQMQAMAHGHPVEAYTLYEWVGAGWYAVIEFLTGQATLVAILPMNWALGAFSVLLAGALAREVTGRDCPAWLLLAGVLGNYVFTDAIVHLYRDALMIPLLLGALLLAVGRRWLPAIAAAVLCGLVRGGNGAMALLAIALLAVARSPSAQRKPAAAMLLCLLAGVALVMLDGVVHYGQYMRSIGESQPVSRPDETLADLAFRRSQAILGGQEEIFREASQRGDDSMRALYALGPAGGLLRPAVTVFAPFKVPPATGETRVRIIREGTFHVQGMIPQFWMQAVTVVLWVAVGPLLILGLLRALRGGLTVRMILLLWSVTVLGVTFVSLQHRHRCAFVVLTPVFLALAQRPWTRREQQGWSILTLLFILGLLVRNMGLVI